ncbi:MAG: MCE family protein [Rhodospirillaceae bacterium]|nr:MCE family protein [Rhodospirillaceae bacterium]
METRASYLAVGTFVLLVSVALLAFVVWLSSRGPSQADDLYVIRFAGSVTGLSVGSPVRYRGIPVGSVDDMSIDPTNLERVRVVIAVRPGTPVVADNVASLELQGIAGGVYVQISGGTMDSPRLLPEPDGTLPEIPSTPSTIQALVQSVPEVLDAANAVLDRANLLLSDDNLDTVGGILADARQVTSALSDMHDGLPALTLRVNEMAQELEALSAEARVDMARISDSAVAALTTTEQQMRTVGDQLAQASGSISQVAGELVQLTRAARPGLVEFTQSGLYEFTLMISELRGLATTLTRVTEQFERDPAQFILGEPVSGVNIR